MHEYFKPWRRKFGVVALVLTCLFASGWVRSLYFNDQIVMPCKDEKNAYFLHSVSGLICLTSINRANESSWLLKWDTVKWDTNKAEPLSENFETSFDWRFRWLGFGFSKLKPGAMGTATMTTWSFPYWSIVIALTLLSAWLVLSKSRKRETALPPST